MTGTSTARLWDTQTMERMGRIRDARKRAMQTITVRMSKTIPMKGIIASRPRIHDIRAPRRRAAISVRSMRTP